MPPHIDGAKTDLGDILNTLSVPIIVVGHDCKVGCFNPAATHALGLKASDIGRHLSDIPLFNETRDIEKLSADVIACGEPSEHEIRNGDRCFLLQIAPYTGSNRQIQGVVLTLTNVTAIRASLAQAIYEREYAKTILNTVAQPLVVLDADLRVQTGNRAFYAMFGASREATHGTPLCNLGNHDWRDASLWSTLRANNLANSEFKTIEVDGDFPALGHRTLLVDANRLGRAREGLMLVGLRDITERKRSENFLQLQKETLEMVVRGLPLADVLAATVRAMEKQSHEKMVTAAHVLNAEGTHFSECIAPNLPESYRQAIRGLAISSKSTPCCLAVLGNRSVNSHDIRAEPAWSAFADLISPLGIRAACATPILSSAGKVIGTLSNYYLQSRTHDSNERQVVDILTRTVALAIERKQAESALRESEERYRTLFTSMNEGFCIIEMVFDESQNPVDYRFLETNPAFAQQTGLQDAKGKLMRELAPAHEKHWFEIYGKIALTGEAARFENRAAALNRWHEVSAFRVEPAEARQVGIVFNDITERKRQEEKLENTVAERTVALRETVGELEAFSYSIAHDMRAPLRGMQGFAGILLDQHAGQLDSQALDYLRRIVASARRLDRLIQDVLNYSKISKGQVVLEPLDLNCLAHDIVETYPNWQPPNAVVKIEGILPKILGNAAFVTQCMSNLVNNAIKFVSPGTLPHVRIWAEEVTPPAAEREPLLGEESSVPQMRLYVEDNGIGIAPGQDTRIFRIFERIHPSSEYEGTGIGLAIARRAAERMGGSIGFKSQLGKGSTFWVQLKRSDTCPK